MVRFKKFYTVIIAVLAVISIALVLFDYGAEINIDDPPYVYIDNFILIIFTIDYFARLYLAKNKKKFFRDNIFDLLAIIPFNAMFSFFRLSRIFRIARLAKLFRFSRLIGLTGKLQRNSKRFIRTNGLIYLIYISAAILIIASVLYSLAEKASLADSFWWAMATATTVGYGDISPHTIVGRLAAIMLMFVGIGFIGMLTSAITNYFTQDNNDDRLDKILEKLDKIEKENAELKKLYSKKGDN